MNFLRRLIFIFSGTPRPKVTPQQFDEFMAHRCMSAILRQAAGLMEDCIKVAMNSDTTPEQWHEAQGRWHAIQWLVDEEKLKRVCTAASDAEMQQWEKKEAQIRAIEKELIHG